MGFWSSTPKDDDGRGTASTAATSWQSGPGVEGSAVLERADGFSGGDAFAFADSRASAGGGNDDGSGFLHPESSLASQRGMGGDGWSRERESQQVELSDVHARKGREGGCCAPCMEWSVKALHAVNASGGLALIVYGSLLITQFTQPAMAAALFCLILGTIHFVTSSLGILSMCFGRCSRFGLVISAYVGPYVSLVYLTIAIALVADRTGFLMYLDDHKEVSGGASRACFGLHWECKHEKCLRCLCSSACFNSRRLTTTAPSATL